MKKAFLILLILSSFSSAFAQKMQLGLRFNPHVSWFNVENKNDTIYLENDGARAWFSYGLMADISFSENYVFSTGLFHNLMGGKTSADNADTSLYSYNKWNLQYIEVPLQLKMKTNEINSIIYYGKFGLTPQIKINSEIDGNTAENVGFFNLYLSVGGGIHYILGGNTAALAGITFHNGLVKINKEKNFSIKTSYLSLDLGILF